MNMTQPKFILLAATMLLSGCAGGAGAGRSQCCSSIAPVKDYPFDRCLVSDERFDHGKPHSFILNGQSIKLCCKDCLVEFRRDKAKYLSKLKPATGTSSTR